VGVGEQRSSAGEGTVLPSGVHRSSARELGGFRPFFAGGEAKKGHRSNQGGGGIESEKEKGKKTPTCLMHNHRINKKKEQKQIRKERKKAQWQWGEQAEKAKTIRGKESKSRENTHQRPGKNKPQGGNKVG